MKTVSRSTRDAAMEAIIEYYEKEPDGKMMISDYLYQAHVVSSVEDARRVFRVLIGMGYITPAGTAPHIARLTDKGWCYFEVTADQQTSIRKRWIHDWKIAVFTTFAGAMLSKPLWDFLSWISSL